MSDIKWSVICISVNNCKVKGVNLFKDYESASAFAVKNACDRLDEIEDNIGFYHDFSIEDYGQYVELCNDGELEYIWTIEPTNTY